MKEVNFNILHMNNINKDIDLSHVLERKKNEENNNDEFIIKNNHKTEFYLSNSKTINWVMRHSFGIIKNENQANVFLLTISIIAIIIAIIFVFSSLYTSTPAIPQSQATKVY